MGILLSFLALAGRWGAGGPLLVQEPPPGKEGGPDWVLMDDRSERQGEIVAVDPTGRLVFRERGRTDRLVPETVRRIRFGPDEPVKADPGAERVYLVHGGLLSGKVLSFERGAAAVETPAGTFRVRRDAIRCLVLGGAAGVSPEAAEGDRDVLIRERGGPGGGPGPGEAAAVAGELLSIGPREVVFRAGGEESIERGSVKKILLRRGREGGAGPPPGWFVKVFFRNGDRIAGVLCSAEPDRVGIFSHMVGEAGIEKRHVRSIHFVRTPRTASDHLLVCDQNGVREFDAQGREVWSFSKNLQYPGSAQRLENGNVLVADMAQNRVVEIEPSGKNGGKIVWELGGLNAPVEAARLEGGNLLVVEQQAGRVAEYDPRTKEPVWTCSGKPLPLGAQRLANGNTLVSSYQGIEEVDRQGRVVWSVPRGRSRPGKALRLEGGNTLVVELQGNRVVELDPQLREVWKAEGLRRPAQAARLEDGTTLVLEQGTGRLVEVDPAGRVAERIGGLNAPRFFSAD